MKRSLVILIVCCQLFIIVSFSAESSISGYFCNVSEERLLDEEIYLNQSIYLDKNGIATSYFFDKEIKKVNKLTGEITDICSKTVLPKHIFGLKRDTMLEMRVFRDSTGKTTFCFEKDVFAQYVGASLNYAGVCFDGREFDISEEMRNVFDLYTKGELFANYCEISLGDTETDETNTFYLKLITNVVRGDGTNYDLSNGFYFIYPYGTTDSFAIDSNTSSANKVFLWKFSGANTQVWKLTRSALNYSCTFKNVYSNNYMLWNNNTMNVELDSTGGIMGNVFIAVNRGGYFTISPCYSSYLVKYDSQSNGSNVCLSVQGNSYANNQKWTFVPVTQLGAAGSYRPISASYGCYPYAMRLSANIVVDGFNSGWTVNQVANFVVTDADLISRGVHCRILESDMAYTSYIKTNEFRVAVRVGKHTVAGVSISGYHFMEQLSNGTWAHKQGTFPSKNNINNPEIDSWDYAISATQTYSGFYDSAIVYLAVSY